VAGEPESNLVADEAENSELRGRALEHQLQERGRELAHLRDQWEAWLSLLSMGESWHHNHHAFPRSAAHGLRRTELDPSAWVIRGMRRLGLAWDVVEIAPERQRAKLAPERERAKLAAGAV